MKRRREYSPEWIRNAWIKFWGLVAPAVLLALWGAQTESALMLSAAGFGLGSVWGNWQTAAFHEMRHMVNKWIWPGEKMEPWVPTLLYALQKEHFMHHWVAKRVEAKPPAERSVQEQAALDRSAVLGTPAMIYLVGQAAYVWVTPILVADMIIGPSANWVSGGFVAATLFTVCVTEDHGHRWHHSLKWKTGFMGILWNWVFSTEQCHGRHHEGDTEEEDGNWGSFDWATPEALVPDFARRLHMFTWSINAIWLLTPVAVGILIGFGSIPLYLALAPAYTLIAWMVLGGQDMLGEYSESYTSRHVRAISTSIE
jgi:hypothetical protein